MKTGYGMRDSGCRMKAQASAMLLPFIQHLVSGIEHRTAKR
jgi:hypothetical protein